MDPNVLLLCIGIAAVLIMIMATIFGGMHHSREGYRDPLYLNKEKMDCAWYPYSNGSIYGNDSNIFTGYQYNDKAY